MSNCNQISQVVSVFQGFYPPEQEIQLAGYTALLSAYELRTPLPDTFFGISHKHTKYKYGHWRMFTPRYAPEPTLYGHLVFALKYEGINLGILKALFDKVAPLEIIAMVKQNPTGAYSRRLWFLYEWLLETELDIQDAAKGNWVEVLDQSLQYGGSPKPSKRHRVHNNLPGTQAFCPLISKTEKLESFIGMQLSEKAQAVLGTIHADVLHRAAAFLLLKDSKASYAIEKETPSQSRAERWGQAIGQAGKHPLSVDEFYRLQKLIIADFRFTHHGYRYEGGFVGEHERSTGMPIPDHISARFQDIETLMDGLIATDQLLKESDIDPVLAAAIIAFGFVFIHPFEDGNGRLHRYLIHHVLAEKKFNPSHVIFPVSAVILKRIDDYRAVLESYSKPRLKFIDWRPTEKGNVDVTNETIDLYRYFDATSQAEFLYECIQETVEVTLPEEINYLEQYDTMKTFIQSQFEMPDRMIDLLIRFLNQNQGKLSKRGQDKEFEMLTSDEIDALESKYNEIFKSGS